MTATRLDPATGNLLAAGKPVFPIGLSDPPPLGSKAPNGADAWAEVAGAGVNFVRNYTVWTAAAAAEQLLEVTEVLDAARRHKLQVWLALAGINTNLAHVSLLDKVVDTVKGHPGLGVWKGPDEPAHGRVPPAGCVAAYKHLRARDPDHPVAIIEAPRAPAPKAGGADKPLTAAAVRPYAAACDIHGVDIYPISVPPGRHAGGRPVNTDISVVGDMTRIIDAATPHKAMWTTLQIAWSGVLPPHPVVFPTLQQARFMAYDAIIAGARGLFFFGGHLKPAMNATDRRRGWNWAYWRKVQAPLVQELAGLEHQRALLAAEAPQPLTSDARDVVVSTRRTSDAIYLIAARRSPVTSGRVRFSGLPKNITKATVLPHPGRNPARTIPVKDGAFTDPSPFRPHNARVYRFDR